MRQPSRVYVLACAVVVLVVFGQAYEWDRAMQAFDNSLRPVWVPQPTRDANRRCFLDNDCYYWITYARQMIQTGAWRIRYTYADNVPYGRDVHWSQSVMWLLVAFGYVRHLFTGETVLAAMEGASIWVNPSLLLLFAILFSWLISRRMGVGAGIMFMLTFATLPDVGWVFHPFRPGHHGLHLACSLGTVLCLVLGGMGWVAKQRAGAPGEESDRRLRYFRALRLMEVGRARKYFAAAGILTGLGLWIGATVQFFTIGALTIGAVCLAFFMPPQLTNQDSDYVPELWRVWSRWAALVGTAFYLVEYFPFHMSLRLEVNNPLYILTLLCVGELMVQLTRWRVSGQSRGIFDYVKVVLLAGGVVLVPCLFLFGPARWHSMRDVEMSRLHNFITEFYTYLNFRPDEPLKVWFLRSYGILPFFLIGALALSGPRRTRLYEWAGLWISFFLCIFTLLLTLWQVRWAALHGAMSIWLMIVVGHIAWRNIFDAPSTNRPTGIAIAVTGLVVLQGVLFTGGEFSELNDICEGKGVRKELVDAAMKKHLAQGLRDANRGRPMRVMCEADEAPALYYFGGIQTVTSLYWENLQGLHDATDFFTDTGDGVARRIARERGLTHVIVSGGENLPAQFNYIKTGDMSVADARTTLLARLQPGRGEAPSWIELDKTLTPIGRRQFSLATNRGVVSLSSLMTVYRLDPDGTASVDTK